jgi:hypothetical protein
MPSLSLMRRFFNARIWSQLGWPPVAIEYLRLNDVDTTTVLDAIPVGGTANQVLKKTTATDYDTEWSAVSHDELSDVQGGAVSEHYHLTSAQVSGLHTRSHAVTSTSDHTAGNWKVFYSDGSGAVIELALGASGYLKSNGASSAPTFGFPAHSETGSLQGGTTGEYYHLTNAIYSRLYTGTGTPEGAVTAGVGSLYLRQDGGAATTLYVKESGTGNTGWVAK